MITLTIKNRSSPTVLTFPSNALSIGFGSNFDVNLSNYSSTPVSGELAKIYVVGDKFWFHNVQNDPFITVNDLSIAKRILDNGDGIQIGDLVLSFEGSLEKSQEQLSHFIEQKVEEKIQDSAVPASAQATMTMENPQEWQQVESDLIGEGEILAFTDEELGRLDLGELVSEIDLVKYDETFQPKDAALFEVDWNGDVQLNTFFPYQKIEETKDPQAAKGGTKDLHLQDLEEDHEIFQANPLTKTSYSQETFIPWKWVGILFFLLLILGLISMSLFYLSLADQRKEEEMKAAAAVSDIAMALMHAKVNNIQPHNQNWSDVEFLRTNLQNIIPDNYAPLIELDSQGQFLGCPYSLRIYMIANRDKFILIAQPAPTLYQWIIPLSALVVDSSLMEIRKINDFRTLNRLLTGPDSMKSFRNEQLTQLIKEGTLIRLDKIAKATNHFELTPPKSLSRLKAGAENFIYNAPRYYKFSQPIIEKSLNLNSNSTSEEISLFHQEIGALKKLPSLVIYSLQGKKVALQVLKGFSTFAPAYNPFIGVISLNSKGLISTSQIVLDGEKNQKMIAIKNEGNDLIAFNQLKDIDDEIDINHPLYIQLKGISEKRMVETAAITEKIIEILQMHQEKPIIPLRNELHPHLEELYRLNEYHQNMIREELCQLHNTYKEFSVAQFLQYVRVFQLENCLEDAISNKGKLEEEMHNREKQMFMLLEEIHRAENLNDLNLILLRASQIVTLDHLKHVDRVIFFQNLCQSYTLDVLTEFIFSSKNHLPFSEFRKENLSVLTSILKNAWVNDPEVMEYYTKQFQAVINSLHQETAPVAF